MKSLGAKTVVDYNSSSVTDEIVDAIKKSGKQFAGTYDSISLPESFKHTYEIAQKAGGSKTIATVLPPSDAPEGVEAKGVFAITIGTQYKEVGEAVWQKFLPGALKDGSIKCVPEPLVVGKGLESVQKGLDVQKEGVSAKKVVIELI